MLPSASTAAEVTPPAFHGNRLTDFTVFMSPLRRTTNAVAAGSVHATSLNFGVPSLLFCSTPFASSSGCGLYADGAGPSLPSTTAFAVPMSSVGPRLVPATTTVPSGWKPPPASHSVPPLPR